MIYPVMYPNKANIEEARSAASELIEHIRAKRLHSILNNCLKIKVAGAWVAVPQVNAGTSVIRELYDLEAKAGVWRSEWALFLYPFHHGFHNSSLDLLIQPALVKQFDLLVASALVHESAHHLQKTTGHYDDEAAKTAVSLSEAASQTKQYIDYEKYVLHPYELHAHGCQAASLLIFTLGCEKALSLRQDSASLDSAFESSLLGIYMKDWPGDVTETEERLQAWARIRAQLLPQISTAMGYLCSNIR